MNASQRAAVIARLRQGSLPSELADFLTDVERLERVETASRAVHEHFVTLAGRGALTGIDEEMLKGLGSVLGPAHQRHAARRFIQKEQ